jgi:hypothetical protein
VDITVKLTLDEVNGLMALMGETPAKMGFFPLLGKIKAQAEAQIPKEDQPVAQAA